MKVPSWILPKRSTTSTSFGCNWSMIQVFCPPVRPSSVPTACTTSCKILPLRNELRGHHTTGEEDIGLGLQPVTLELEVVAGVAFFQDAPGLVVGDQLHALDDVVRHLGPAVIKPLAIPGCG